MILIVINGKHLLALPQAAKYVIGGKVGQDRHTFAISTILNVYLLLANKLEQV